MCSCAVSCTPSSSATGHLLVNTTRRIPFEQGLAVNLNPSCPLLVIPLSLPRTQRKAIIFLEKTPWKPSPVPSEREKDKSRMTPLLQGHSQSEGKPLAVLAHLSEARQERLSTLNVSRGKGRFLCACQQNAFRRTPVAITPYLPLPY